MRVVVIEDEKPAARLLERKLHVFGIQPVALLHSVEESIAWLRQNEMPDLMFVDIQLSDGLSFEIFENVPNAGAIIFTTAYDEFALKAFKLNAIDYLLKPIDEDELRSAIDKYKRLRPVEQPFDLTRLRELFASASTTYRERFTIKIGQQLKVIPIGSVECIYSENKGTFIHTTDSRTFAVDGSLDALENELDPKQFFRVSRKFIIPITAIRDIHVYSNSRLKISLPTFKDDDVVVSREKVHEFKQWIK